MIYILALVGAVTIAVLLWRAFGPESTAQVPSTRHRPLAPDDDPDFLRSLDPPPKPKPGTGDGPEAKD